MNYKNELDNPQAIFQRLSPLVDCTYCRYGLSKDFFLLISEISTSFTKHTSALCNGPIGNKQSATVNSNSVNSKFETFLQNSPTKIIFFKLFLLGGGGVANTLSHQS
jgi:hypothetical protein